MSVNLFEFEHAGSGQLYSYNPYNISTGKGQLAGVEFVAVDGGTSDKEADELCDATAQKLIRFDDLNPFTYTQKTLILSNVT